MKKLFIVLLALGLLFVSCGQSSNTSNTATGTMSKAVVPEENTMLIPTKTPPEILDGKVISGSIENINAEQVQKVINGFKANREIFENIDKMFDKYEDLNNFDYVLANNSMDIAYISCHQRGTDMFPQEKAENVIDIDDFKILQSFYDEFFDIQLIECRIDRTRDILTEDGLNHIYNFTEFRLAQSFNNGLIFYHDIIKFRRKEDFEQYVKIIKSERSDSVNDDKIGDMVYVVDFGANWYYAVCYAGIEGD